MTEIIAMLTKKQNLSPEPTETIGLTFPEMELFPYVRRGSSKEIWPLRAFYTVSLLLVDLHPGN